MVLDRIRRLAASDRKRIVFADDDERVREAAGIVEREGIAEPVFVPALDQEMVDVVRERRSVGAGDAEALLRDPYWRAAALVASGRADGMIAGAARPTEDSLRAILKVIGARDFASSCMLMTRSDERFLFADCGMNPEPDSERLAQIAIMTARTAEMLGIEPRIAMLSFSTKGSSADENAERVRRAVAIARECRRDLTIDGELQFDAAYVREIAERKSPGSTVAGKANVFIFPSLDAGNIGYKIAERLAGFRAVGPILQGLRMPANDLSRGCSVQDIVDLAAITAVQAQRS